MLFNEYQKQARQFLKETGSSLEILPAGQEISNWHGKLVNKYKGTLKNPKGFLSFDYFDSISNTERGISAREDYYSVLCCLNILDLYENFDDYLSQCGIEIKTELDYINAKKNYLEIERQEKTLKKMFSSEEISKLQEIN